MRWMRVAAYVAVIGVAAGCASPRVVRCDPAGGVVAIPANTNSWPTYHRNKAEEIIRQKCPNGYEIVSEEEVVTGQTALTNSQTERKDTPTLLLGGQDPGDKKAGRGDANAFSGLAVPLGETKQVTNQTTTYHNITEWRIEYRAK